MIHHTQLKILIACERTGAVREAFEALGVKAISCDTKDTVRPGTHYVGSVEDILHCHWDMLIGFPPCTWLTNVNRWNLKHHWHEHNEAITFFLKLYARTVNFIAIENPVGIMNTIFKKPTQIIHPWQFGHEEEKQTCLWLRNLPQLRPTQIMQVRTQRLAALGSCPGRSDIRSATFLGIAAAMAAQWLWYLLSIGYLYPDETFAFKVFEASHIHPANPYAQLSLL